MERLPAPEPAATSLFALVAPEFAGRGRRFLGTLILGAFLQIITLGLYRFWLVSDIRRQLWSATVVDGAPLEYTGRGQDLLLGVLLVIAVAALLSLGVTAAAFAQTIQIRVSAGVLVVVVIYVFGQFAVFRARRYRLRRTRWRGASFWMAGSGWSYALRSCFWSLLAILTLGLALPWRAAALEGYKMRNTYYGDIQGDFVGKGWSLFKAGFLVWLLTFVSATSLCMFAAYFALGQEGEGIGSLSLPDFNFRSFSPVALAGLAGALCFVLAGLWAMYRAIRWRWFLSGLRFGDVAFHSALARSKVLTLYLRLILATMAASLILEILFFLAAMELRDVINPGFADRLRPVWISGSILLLLVLLMAADAAYRFFLQHQFWRAIVASIRIGNLETAAGVLARGSQARTLGEGLADRLDRVGL
jgi:uncharacterized membrane protein YjgN (DUF898 family)